MKTKLSSLALFLLLTSCGLFEFTPSQKLSSFKTDMCTLFPNRSQAHPDQDWSHCCVAHDISYWLGGPERKRKKADDQLKACVKKTGAVEASTIMRTGVELGGAPYFQTPWAWGFGWRQKKNDSTFTPKQVQMIIQKWPSVLGATEKFKKRWTDKQYKYVQDYLKKMREDLRS